MFISQVCFLFVCIGPEKPPWGSGQLRLLFFKHKVEIKEHFEMSYSNVDQNIFLFFIYSSLKLSYKRL